MRDTRARLERLERCVGRCAGKYDLLTLADVVRALALRESGALSDADYRALRVEPELEALLARCAEADCEGD